MKKITILILGFIFIGICNMEAQLTVKYYSEVESIESSKQLYNLYVDKNKSYFTIIPQEKKYIKDIDEYAHSDKLSVSLLDELVFYRTDNFSKLIEAKLKSVKDVSYVREDITQIEWKITNEQKKIGEFNCLKATADFRGRSYIAWFTPDIPISLGPWKLHGLPGLIVYVSDKDNVVSFTAYEIERQIDYKLIDDINKTLNDKSNRWITSEEFFEHGKKEMAAQLNMMIMRFKKQNPNSEIAIEEPETWEIY